MTERLARLIKWLKINDYDGYQVFYCRNWTGDPMATIRDEDDIVVDFCNYYSYLEIFGLTNEEQDALCEESGCLKL